MLRIDPVRLFPGDRHLVEDYAIDPAPISRAMTHARWNPWTASRARLLGMTVHGVEGGRGYVRIVRVHEVKVQEERSVPVMVQPLQAATRHVGG